MSLERSVRLDEPELPHELAIESLTEAFAPDAKVRKVNWARLRGFLDQLTEHPELTAQAITSPPHRTGDAAYDALLAGIAEKLAGIPRPRWTPFRPTVPHRVGAARHTSPHQASPSPGPNLWRTTA